MISHPIPPSVVMLPNDVVNVTLHPTLTRISAAQQPLKRKSWIHQWYPPPLSNVRFTYVTEQAK